MLEYYMLTYPMQDQGYSTSISHAIIFLESLTKFLQIDDINALTLQVQKLYDILNDRNTKQKFRDHELDKYVLKLQTEMRQTTPNLTIIKLYYFLLWQYEKEFQMLEQALGSQGLREQIYPFFSQTCYILNKIITLIKDQEDQSLTDKQILDWRNDIFIVTKYFTQDTESYSQLSITYMKCFKELLRLINREKYLNNWNQYDSIFVKAFEDLDDKYNRFVQYRNTNPQKNKELLDTCKKLLNNSLKLAYDTFGLDTTKGYDKKVLLQYRQKQADKNYLESKKYPIIRDCTPPDDKKNTYITGSNSAGNNPQEDKGQESLQLHPKTCGHLPCETLTLPHNLVPAENPANPGQSSANITSTHNTASPEKDNVHLDMEPNNNDHKSYDDLYDTILACTDFERLREKLPACLQDFKNKYETILNSINDQSSDIFREFSLIKNSIKKIENYIHNESCTQTLIHYKLYYLALVQYKVYFEHYKQNDIQVSFMVAGCLLTNLTDDLGHAESIAEKIWRVATSSNLSENGRCQVLQILLQTINLYKLQKRSYNIISRNDWITLDRNIHIFAEKLAKTTDLSTGQKFIFKQVLKTAEECITEALCHNTDSRTRHIIALKDIDIVQQKVKTYLEDFNKEYQTLLDPKNEQSQHVTRVFSRIQNSIKDIENSLEDKSNTQPLIKYKLYYLILWHYDKYLFHYKNGDIKTHFCLAGHLLQNLVKQDLSLTELTSMAEDIDLMTHQGDIDDLISSYLEVLKDTIFLNALLTRKIIMSDMDLSSPVIDSSWVELNNQQKKLYKNLSAFQTQVASTADLPKTIKIICDKIINKANGYVQEVLLYNLVRPNNALRTQDLSTNDHSPFIEPNNFQDLTLTRNQSPNNTPITNSSNNPIQKKDQFLPTTVRYETSYPALEQTKQPPLTEPKPCYEILINVIIVIILILIVLLAFYALFRSVVIIDLKTPPYLPQIPQPHPTPCIMIN